mmetsp:Transcript_26788/g.46113  ORF Transcript_26788/g.46113 Transcript_26788/m.46113 type:complete len:432 (-) Transcript_26788:14-1309(-)
MGSSVSHSAIELLYDCQDGVEGPIWSCNEKVLMWIDHERRRVFRYDPAAKVAPQVYPLFLDEVAGSIHLVEDKPMGIIIALEKGGVVSHSLGGHKLVKECSIRSNVQSTGFNTGTCDQNGRLLFGGRERFRIGPKGKDQSPDSLIPVNVRSKNSPSTGFYKLEGKKLSPLQDRLFAVAHRLAFSPDGNTIYLLDGPERIIWACRYNISMGVLQGSPHKFYCMLPEQPGFPSDAVSDVLGHRYVSYEGGSCVRRHQRGCGTVDLVIELPCPRVTGLAWGGDELTKLFIATGSNNQSLRQQQGSVAEQEKEKPLEIQKEHFTEQVMAGGQLYSVTVTEGEQVVTGASVTAFKQEEEQHQGWGSSERGCLSGQQICAGENMADCCAASVSEAGTSCWGQDSRTNSSSNSRKKMSGFSRELPSSTLSKRWFKKGM